MKAVIPLDVIYTVATRVLLVIAQLFIFILVLKSYGTEPAGYYSLAMGTFSLFLMVSTFTISKFVVVRYKRRSYTFFFSVVLWAVIGCFFVLTLSGLYFDELSLTLLYSFYFVKVFDFYNEINLIYYRRRSREKELFFIQLTRSVLAVVILISAIKLGVEIYYAFMVISLLYLPFFILGSLSFKLNFHKVFSSYSLLAYKQMYKDGWPNGVNGSLSTAYTNSPKYAVGLFLSLDAVAIYSLVAYSYTTLCTLGSMLLQVYFSKVEDIKTYWFNSVRLFMALTTIVITMLSLITLFIAEPLYNEFFSYKVEGFSYFCSLMMLLAAPLISRDFFSYYLIKVNKISINNFSVLIAIVLFWLLTILSFKELKLIDISIYMLSSAIISLGVIGYLTFNTRLTV